MINNSPDSAPEAKLKKLRGVSLIWTVPVLALIITTLLLWQNTINIGPTVKLEIDNATGLTAGKTEVKFRSVNVGMVKAIDISSDYEHTEITIQMNPGTGDLLNKDSLFWVVKPKVEYSSITGLETLLSGAYIALSKGSSPEKSDHFVCLKENPVPNLKDYSGTHLTIVSKLNRRAKPGDPLTYRGFEAGQIIGASYDVIRNQAVYQVVVSSPFDKFINQETKFWLHSGYEMSFGPTGFLFSTDNMRGLLQGGIDFDNYGAPIEGSSEKNDEYILFRNEKEARASALKTYPLYVVLFKGSADNITVGSRVLYQGVTVGEVVEKPLFAQKNDLFTRGSFNPVLLAINYDTEEPLLMKNLFDGLIDQNEICAKLGPGTLMVPGTSIVLDLYPEDKCKLSRHTYLGYKVIASSDTVDSNDISGMIAKIKEFDVKGTSDELKQSLQSLDNLLVSLAKITDQINHDDTVADLNAALKAVVQTLDSFRKTSDSFGHDSQLSQSINDTLSELRKLLKDLAPAMREIGQKPNTILFGSDRKDLEPGRRTR